MTAHDLTTKGKPVTTPITTTLRALTADTETLLAARLRPLGITVPQLEFLTVYATQPDSCGADAARACHVTPQTGTSVLRGLTNRGLIKAKRIPGNGRRHVITVTPAGHKTLADARTATRDIEERLSALLGTEAAFRMQDATKVLETQVAGGRPKVLRDNPDIRDAVHVARSLRVHVGVQNSVSGLSSWLFHNIDTEDHNYFFDKLASGAGLEETDPILKLREKLLADVGAKRRLRKTEILALFIKSWNHFRDGNGITQLKFTAGGRAPEAMPKPH